MNLYTIGFTKKSAKNFFTLLRDNQIKQVVDIRLNNVSQLAGFSKGEDLRFFLNEFCDIGYIHDTNLAPTKELLNDYKEKNISWQKYEVEFNNLLNERNIKEKLNEKYKMNFDGTCLLCSEVAADKCHRRLVAEYIMQSYPALNISIRHL